MKKLVTILCVMMIFSVLVSCGGTSSVTNNEPKTSTTKTENVVNTQINEKVVDKKVTKPAETPKIDEKKEQVLIELMTIENILNKNLAYANYKGDYLDYYFLKEISTYISNSKIISQELKNRLVKPINDNRPPGNGSYGNYGDSKFKAILDVEIEKHKLP